MTDLEKIEYKPWLFKLNNEDFEKEYATVKKMIKSDASQHMLRTCEAEKAYRKIRRNGV